MLGSSMSAPQTLVGQGWIDLKGQIGRFILNDEYTGLASKGDEAGYGKKERV